MGSTRLADPAWSVWHSLAAKLGFRLAPLNPPGLKPERRWLESRISPGVKHYNGVGGIIAGRQAHSTHATSTSRLLFVCFVVRRILIFACQVFCSYCP